MTAGKSGVDSYCFDAICVFRSLELPRLLGSADVSELSDRCARWDDLGAFKLPRKDLDASRECLVSLGESLGEGKY